MKKLLFAFILVFIAVAPVGEVVAQDAPTVTGTWDYEVETPRGTNGGTIVLTDSSGMIGGKINPNDGEATPLENVELSGDSLSCEYPTDGYGTATMEIVFDGDSFEGGMSVSRYGPFPVQGTRQE